MWALHLASKSNEKPAKQIDRLCFLIGRTKRQRSYVKSDHSDQQKNTSKKHFCLSFFSAHHCAATSPTLITSLLVRLFSITFFSPYRLEPIGIFLRYIETDIDLGARTFRRIILDAILWAQTNGHCITGEFGHSVIHRFIYCNPVIIHWAIFICILIGKQFGLFRDTEIRRR